MSYAGYPNELSNWFAPRKTRINILVDAPDVPASAQTLQSDTRIPPFRHRADAIDNMIELGVGESEWI